MDAARTRTILGVVVVLLLILVPSIAQTTGGAVYLDPSQAIDVRVSDLVGRMTLEAHLLTKLSSDLFVNLCIVAFEI